MKKKMYALKKFFSELKVNLKNHNVCIKSEDNTTHHPHLTLEWDIPPRVFSILMAEGEAQ